MYAGPRLDTNNLLINDCGPEIAGEIKIWLGIWCESRLVEGQELPRAKGPRGQNLASKELLLTGGRARRAHHFRRIKEALVPEGRVRQCAGFPLPHGRSSGSDHAAIGRIEDENNSSHGVRFLRKIVVVLAEQ